MEGSLQFLKAAGFELKSLPNANNEMEDFWLYSRTRENHMEYLTVSRRRRVKPGFYSIASLLNRVFEMVWLAQNRFARSSIEGFAF